MQLRERKINLLSRDKIGVDIGAVSEVSKAKCSDLQKMEFRMQCRKFIVALIGKIIERSPLKYKATRAMSCINPSLILYNRTTSEGRMKDLLQIVLELGHMSSAEADDALATFSELCRLAQTKYRKLFANFDRTDQNLSVFYSKILAGDGKQAALWKVVRMVLTLSHGQAGGTGVIGLTRGLARWIQEPLVVRDKDGRPPRVSGSALLLCV